MSNEAWVRTVEELEALPWAWGIRHQRCGFRWSVEDVIGPYEIDPPTDGLGNLHCYECEETGGFIALRESWTKVPNWLLRGEDGLGLKPIERCLILNLWSRESGNDKGYSWTGIPTMAADLSVSESSVTRALNSLVNRKIVRRQRRQNKTNLYSVRAFIESRPDPVRSNRPNRLGQIDLSGQVNLTPEVDLPEVDPVRSIAKATPTNADALSDQHSQETEWDDIPNF